MYLKFTLLMILGCVFLLPPTTILGVIFIVFVFLYYAGKIASEYIEKEEKAGYEKDQYSAETTEEMR